jgi:hypothetical protein
MYCLAVNNTIHTECVCHLVLGRLLADDLEILLHELQTTMF